MPREPARRGPDELLAEIDALVGPSEDKEPQEFDFDQLRQRQIRRLQRENSQTVVCPACGTEVWTVANSGETLHIVGACPKCGMTY